LAAGTGAGAGAGAGAGTDIGAGAGALFAGGMEVKASMAIEGYKEEKSSGMGDKVTTFSTFTRRNVPKPRFYVLGEPRKSAHASWMMFSHEF
jgi:hypothetical protein